MNGKLRVFLALLVFFFFQAFSVLANPPTLLAPTDSSTWNSGFEVEFEYNVTDTTNVDNCTLFVDGNVEDIDIDVTLGANEYLYAPLYNGDHSWYVTCTDDTGQNETSGTFDVTVSYTGEDNLTLINLGQAGFEQTNPEVTSLRTVIADAQFNSSSTYCSYKNLGEWWSTWGLCEDQKYWLLKDENGEQLVWIRINHSNGRLSYAYDTITLNKRGYGLDMTYPQAPDVIDDGAFTNKNDSIHFRWENGYDRESELLRIPLQYEFRINNTNYTEWHNVTGLSEITVPINLVELQNYTIEIRVTNSGNLTNTSQSDGIVVDLTAPVRSTGVSSDYSGGWQSHGNISFDWIGTFSDGMGSGVGAYSFTLTSKNNTVPDSIPEGVVGNLAGKTNHSFTGLSSGEYYFHLTARDVAGNWATGSAVFHSEVIQIDRTAPSIPLMQSASQNSTDGTITFNWTAATDAHSGVAGYYLQLSPTRGFDTVVLNRTTGNVTSYETTVPFDATWYARVRAFDEVGNYGFFSDLYGKEIDVTPPQFTFLRPNGTIVENPTYVVRTNENAVCTYDGMRFTYTNSTHHEVRPTVSEGSHSVLIACTDDAGLTNTTTLDFNYNSALLVTDVGVTLPTVFSGRDSMITAYVQSGGEPIGEISKSRFSLSIDGQPVDFSLEDETGGQYSLGFTAPSKSGSYELNLTVDSATPGIQALTVSDLLLRVVFVGSVSPSNMARLTSSAFGSSTFGFATDSNVAVVGSSPGQMQMDMGTDNGVGFIFLTRPEAKLKSKEVYLEESRFFELINPTFGYQIRDSHLVRADLSYSDIYIQGSRKLASGKYNMVLKNEGLDSQDRTLITLNQI